MRHNGTSNSLINFFTTRSQSNDALSQCTHRHNALSEELIMYSALTMTEKKMKVAAKRLPLELASAGVDTSTMGHAKTLDILSKTLFGKPFTEVKATLLAGSEPAKAVLPAVVEIEHGSNIILAIDGCYIAATNPGTDLEIPYHALAARAASEAAKHGVGVRNANLSGLCVEVESDDEVVEMAERMGFFRPEGSFFEALENAEMVLIDGAVNEVGLHMNWEELVSDADYPNGECIWWPRTENMDGSESDFISFTFEDLCNAVCVKEGLWSISNKTENGEHYRISLKTLSVN